MMTVFINDEVLQERIPAFFRFAADISDSFAVSRQFGGKLPKELYNKVNNELRAEINKDDAARREKYKKDEKYARELKQVMGITTKKQAVKYFDDVKKQDMRAITASRKLTDDEQFASEREDYIETVYSKQTAVKRGPLFELARFKCGETLKLLTSGLKSVYDSPFVVDGCEFEDIAFYKDGEVKLGICSAERFCLLRLTKEELNDFVKLKPTHELS